MPQPESYRRLLGLVAILWLPTANSAELDLFPGDSFENAVENLIPGDTLTIHAGTYTDAGRVSIGVRGTAAEPVLIQAAAGEARPLITRNGSASIQNTVNIEGASYLTIRGLEISSNGGDAINMNGDPSFITLEDLDIHDISVGINFRSDMHNIIVRGNHIYRTNDTGEGMYVGCNNSACVVRDSLIENNWIHDTSAAFQGDGIEIKKGSHSNVIRNNVIHDTNYPCILVYATDGNPRNVVEGNVVWNCGDSGIQAAADALVTNNIIIDSPGNGFNSQPHQGATPENLEFSHNTIVGGDPCLRIADWSNKQGLTFANNAVYCASGSYVVGDLSDVVVAGNVIEPATSRISASGYTSGRSLAQDFVDAGNRNFYPSADSPLLDAGDAAHAVSLDFNGQPRTGNPDAGAYTWNGDDNPGWPVAPGFKNMNPGPDLSLVASPSTVALQGQSMLSWEATHAAGCTASGAWSGDRSASGEEMVGPLSNTSQYTLTCLNTDNVAASQSVTIIVSPGTAPPPTLVFSAESSSVSANEDTTLNWSSTDADSCIATDGWSGPKALSGTETTEPLLATTIFELACSGIGGNTERSLTVQVQTGPPGPDGNTGETSGSGAAHWGSLLLCCGLVYRRERRP